MDKNVDGQLQSLYNKEEWVVRVRFYVWTNKSTVDLVNGELKQKSV